MMSLSIMAISVKSFLMSLGASISGQTDEIVFTVQSIVDGLLPLVFYMVVVSMLLMAFPQGRKILKGVVDLFD